jgi:plastocyanin
VRLASLSIAVIIIILAVFFFPGYAQIPQVIISSGSSSPFSPQFYVPANKTISRGESVTWRNDDTIDHSVTFINPLLNAPIDIVKPNSNIIFKFNEVGRYDYYCRFYPFMTGQIVVIDR